MADTLWKNKMPKAIHIIISRTYYLAHLFTQLFYTQANARYRAIRCQEIIISYTDAFVFTHNDINAIQNTAIIIGQLIGLFHLLPSSATCIMFHSWLNHRSHVRLPLIHFNFIQFLVPPLGLILPFVFYSFLVLTHFDIHVMFNYLCYGFHKKNWYSNASLTYTY
jgi:hypothetical protein